VSLLPLPLPLPFLLLPLLLASPERSIFGMFGTGRENALFAPTWATPNVRGWASLGDSSGEYPGFSGDAEDSLIGGVDVSFEVGREFSESRRCEDDSLSYEDT
jgi:hypothetical protein